MQTKMKTHRWNELSQTPVEVIGHDLNGLAVVMHQEEPRFGISCMDCYAPLTPENREAECTGPGDGDLADA